MSEQSERKYSFREDIRSSKDSVESGELRDSPKRCRSDSPSTELKPYLRKGFLYTVRAEFLRSHSKGHVRKLNAREGSLVSFLGHCKEKECPADCNFSLVRNELEEVDTGARRVHIHKIPRTTM